MKKKISRRFARSAFGLTRSALNFWVCTDFDLFLRSSPLFLNKNKNQFFDFFDRKWQLEGLKRLLRIPREFVGFTKLLSRIAIIMFNGGKSWKSNVKANKNSVLWKCEKTRQIDSVLHDYAQDFDEFFLVKFVFKNYSSNWVGFAIFCLWMLQFDVLFQIKLLSKDFSSN